jgi:hypothetical protein
MDMDEYDLGLEFEELTVPEPLSPRSRSSTRDRLWAEESEVLFAGCCGTLTVMLTTVRDDTVGAGVANAGRAARAPGGSADGTGLEWSRTTTGQSHDCSTGKKT